MTADFVGEGLPAGVSAYSRTPTFTARTIPENLRSAHRTKADTWAQIVVLEGRLLYRVLEPETCEIELSPGRPGVAAPQVRHEVEARGDVRFYVEFCR